MLPSYAVNDSKWGRELSRQLYRIASESSEKELDPFRYGLSWERGGRCLTIHDEPAQAFLHCASNTAKRLSERFSESTIWERLISAIFAARYDGEEECRLLVDNLIAEFETWSIEQTVYVPVEGLDLVVPRLSIGPVLFIRMEGLALESILAVVERIGTDEATAERNDAYVVQRQDEIRRDLEGKVCAVFRVVAESVRAQERAEEETRRALDVLMYANALTYPSHPRADAFLAIRGEKPGGSGTTLTISDRRIVDNLQSPPRSWSVEVGWSFMNHMRELGVGELSWMLSSPLDELTDLEAALRSAIHWFGYSQTQRDPEGQITSLFTALEVLVPQGLHGKTQKRITLGPARILGQDKGDPIYERIKQLYADRNEVAHGGKIGKTRADAQELRWIVARVINTLLINLTEVDNIAALETRLTVPISGKHYLSPFATKQLAPVYGTGKSIRDVRRARGLSQEELAKKTSKWTTPDQIEYWENQVQSPPFSDLLKIATALAVDPLEFEFDRYERLIRVQGCLYYLKVSQSDDKQWTARVRGWELPKCRPDVGIPPEDGLDDHQENVPPEELIAMGSKPEEALRSLEIRVGRFVKP